MEKVKLTLFQVPYFIESKTKSEMLTSNIAKYTTINLAFFKDHNLKWE